MRWTSAGALLSRATTSAFFQISYLLLFLSGVKLIWDALA